MREIWRKGETEEEIQKYRGKQEKEERNTKKKKNCAVWDYKKRLFLAIKKKAVKGFVVHK